jgi:hypothetical protein
MHVKAGPLGKPVPDHRRFVSSVVIQDQMHIQTAGNLRLDHIEESTKLLRPVPAVSCPITRLVFSSSAANSEVVPWRL